MQFKCAQKGCEFDADEAPDNCPVCNHPFVESDLVDYTVLTKPSLIDELTERGITPGAGESAFNRWSKEDLVDTLLLDDDGELDQDDD